ncbi:D-xylose transport system substrate-binding protein [Streptomyces sp. 1114.5]|uniref:sugar ABC transporter substrate-binding protein n=1 Tax=unclassified Streptomyces TaxID=2593676 RepID=UPI000BD7A5F9|nr:MULTISPECIES: substrate-binding domain-containing protein [unclassified Streptomyces]RKT19534.1 D-xylose transport system substrate-binding protein [Streptomyces sp. 1114.5]SOB85731.1 monosaccharide ABC transporter substrate-binding protein, CUT2 family [Streptomyces sp. 1331.2]
MSIGLRRVLAVTAVVSLGLGAASCGSAKQSSGGGSSGSANASGGASVGAVRIGLLLPESKTTRYEQFDRPLIEQRIKELAPQAQIDYYNANQDATLQQTQVDTALTKGDKVLILDAVDAKSIQSSVQKAHDAGVKVLAYDRLAQGPADAYVSFDNHKVGELQGKALVAAVGDKANAGSIIMINGSPTDPNAADFKAGAHSAIDGKLKIGKEYDTPNWDPNNANQEASAAITAIGANNVVGVYSANDGMAAGIATALKAAGLSVPLTGQDAQLDAIQRILAGTQTMTIYKPFKPETDVAARMAVALAGGKPLDSSLAPTTVTNGSGHKVPANLITPIVVDKNNVKDTVVKDGLYTVAQICTPDFADACKAAGLE